MGKQKAAGRERKATPSDNRQARAIRVTGDASALKRDLASLLAAIAPLERVPQFLLDRLDGLIAHLGDEVLLSRSVTATRANEHRYALRFRRGGRFERCLAAARTLRRQVSKTAHEGLPSRRLKGRTSKFTRRERPS